MGFKTINYDNYAGEVIFGDGEREFGIIGHLDIVPAGTGWETDPFTLTEKDGVLFGRGLMDDKMPTLLILYAFNELKNSELMPNCKFRLFVGCNEESGWKDIEYLKSKTTLPEYGFSPDGIFPLSYAEKGMYEVGFLLPKFKNFTSLSGGNAINAVCALAFVTAKTDVDYSLLKKHNLTIKDGVITSVGRAAHGSAPHLGKNAFLSLLKFMCESGEDLENVIACLFDDVFGISTLTNEQGKVTISPNLIKEVDGKTYLLADLRIPAPFTLETVLPIIEKFNIEYTVKGNHPPVIVEKNGAFVSALLSAYVSITGEKDSKPESMAGSTFARAFSKGCSFGPEFSKKDYRIHNSNENVSVVELEKMYEIYKTALLNLSNID